jgi:hypothetical protein
METWEEEGFASEEAYNKYQQTIKDLEAEKQKLLGQVDEKQKVIDGNRTKISELSDSKKELDDLKAAKDKKEQEAREEAERKNKEEELANQTPEKIAERNTKRIAELSPQQREQFKQEYEQASAEQKALLEDPEKMEAYLELKLGGTSQTSNPFDIEKKQTTVPLKEQVAQAFGLVDNNSPALPSRDGSGFKPTEAVKTKQEKNSAKIEEAREHLLAI